MAEYTYLDDLPEGEAGSGSSEEFGTAAFEDVGTAADEIPFTSDVQDMIDSSSVGALGIMGVRIFTSSQEVTLNDGTSRVLFILIGGGAGGAYYTGQFNYGGGAGGVSVVYKSVAGGAVLGLTIGSGGTGGTYSSRDGGAGSPSSFTGISSAGGGDYFYTTEDTDPAFLSYVGGEGSADFDNGVLWGKRGGFGYVPNGGNPWADWTWAMIGSGDEQQVQDTSEGYPLPKRNFTTPYEYLGALPSWLTIARGVTAQYGYGGCGGIDGDEDGQDGGDGILILVELA
jgi:hypothetical protein